METLFNKTVPENTLSFPPVPENTVSFVHDAQRTWACYLFGSKPGEGGIIWYPPSGCVPNFVVRFFMRVLLGCTWIKSDV